MYQTYQIRIHSKFNNLLYLFISLIGNKMAKQEYNKNKKKKEKREGK